MDFILQFFWNHLPYCQTKRMLIDGKEEDCLIIPAKINQIKKGKRGNWLSTFRIVEVPPNVTMKTHELQLGYLNYAEVDKAKNFGYYCQTQRMGNVYEHDRTPEKKIDHTNKATDIRLDGIIVLSDIDKSLVILNTQNNKRYLSNLTIRGLREDGKVFCGSICIDDIERECIEVNPNDGKKFIRTRLRKMQNTDTYFNTHELVIVKSDGSELQIGLFKEFQKEGFQPTQTPPLPEEYNNQNNNQRKVPDSIQGIRF